VSGCGRLTLLANVRYRIFPLCYAMPAVYDLEFFGMSEHRWLLEHIEGVILEPGGK
jgi:hypothetical protein